MAFDAKVYRIVIASPSDVEEERDLVSSLIQSWNDLYSSTRKTVLLPLKWETHTAPEYGTRPQEVVNRAIIDECDLLVGIFWCRIGSPTGVADSGTLEEIERVGNAGKPVMLYFSRIPIEPDKMDFAQFEKLQDFKQKTYPKGLVETYSRISDFRDKFSRQLEMKVRQLQDAEASGKSPLSFTFLSVDDGSQLGNFEKKIYQKPIFKDLDCVPTELQNDLDKLLQKKMQRDSYIPILLAIENIGSVGIRNTYVEFYFRADSSEFILTNRRQLGSRRVSFNLLWGSENDDQIDEIIQQSEPGSLQKIGEGWQLSQSWDAVQPQRKRIVKPVLYISSPISCNLEISARIYSDSFTIPLVLNASCRLEVTNVDTELSEFIPDWKEKISDKDSVVSELLIQRETH